MRIVFITGTLLLFISCNKPIDHEDDRGNKPGKLGIIFFSNNGGLTAYDLDNEVYAWRIKGITTHDFHSTIFENGILYSADMYGATAVDASNGNIKWQTFVGNTNYRQNGTEYYNSPVIIDSFIYTVTFNGASEHASLNALNKNTGQIIWKKDISEGMSVVEWRYTTPLVFENKIVVISCDELQPDRMYCLNRFTGDQIWQKFENNLSYGNFPVLSVDKKRIFIQANNSNIIASIDPDSGDIQWSKQLQHIVDPAEMQIWNNNLYFSSVTEFNSIEPTGLNAAAFPLNFASIEFSEGKFYSINYEAGISCYENAQRIWNVTLPSKLYLDTARRLDPLGYDYYLSSVVVDDQNIIFNQRINSGTFVNSYSKNLFYVLDKENGNVVKEIQLSEPVNVFPIGRNFVLVKENKPYYCDRGYLPKTF